MTQPGRLKLPRLRRRTALALLGLLAASTIAAALAWPTAGPRSTGPLPHDVYVWQRAWTDPVRSAVTAHAPQFRQIVVLAAQVWWTDPARRDRPKVARVAVDYSALKSANLKVGLALRINDYRGPFDESAPAADLLTNLAADLIAESRAAGVEPAELQLDFDSAESQLEGYRQWVAAISRRVAPVPVVITALPAWLDAPAFEPLAKAAGRYVLQVHSFDRPRLSDRMTICDPEAARAAVERAGKIGVPFHVALPTYGYTAAFRPDGTFLALSAEGRQSTWPADAQVREVRSNPAELAALVTGWTNDRPAALAGVIWYRLPTEADSLNWRWPTLAAVMKGQTPTARLAPHTAPDSDGATSIQLHNQGDADTVLTRNSAILVRSSGAIQAADGLAGFSATWQADTARFTPAAARIRPGERLTIGWLRAPGPVEVTIHEN